MSFDRSRDAYDRHVGWLGSNPSRVPGMVEVTPYLARTWYERGEQLRAAVRRRLGDPSGVFTLTARAWFVRGVVHA